MPILHLCYAVCSAAKNAEASQLRDKLFSPHLFGSSMERVLHLTIYLTDMADRAAFNEVYKRFFAKPWPVRAAVGVAELAVAGMRVEVTAMAAKG